MTLGLEGSLISRSSWPAAQVIWPTWKYPGKVFLSARPAAENVPRQVVIYSRQDYKITTKSHKQVISFQQGKTPGIFSCRLWRATRDYFSCPTWRTAAISSVPMLAMPKMKASHKLSHFCVSWAFIISAHRQVFLQIKHTNYREHLVWA